ncbi:MAG: PH domain-containing protein [Pseudomonadota bacterium]
MVPGNGASRLKLFEPYVVKSLPEHERLIAIACFPWILRAASWTILVVLGAGPILALLGLLATGQLTNLWAGLGITASVAGIAWFLMIETYITTTEFGLTDHRLVVKRGFFGRATAELPLVAIENVLLRQSFVSRVFRYGRLQINGSGGSPIFSPPIADPVTFRAAITEASIQMQTPEHHDDQSAQSRQPRTAHDTRSQPQKQARAPGERPHVGHRDAPRPAERPAPKKRRPPPQRPEHPASQKKHPTKAATPPQRPGGAPRRLR